MRESVVRRGGGRKVFFGGESWVVERILRRVSAWALAMSAAMWMWSGVSAGQEAAPKGGLPPVSELAKAARDVSGTLKAYVEKDDGAFAWKVKRDNDFLGVKVTYLEMTSQNWRGIEWTHALAICEPAELVAPETGILFITGGRKGNDPREGDLLIGTMLARLSGARVGVLLHVPNQPLMGDRVEDDLIAETFLEYLKSGDLTWPLLLPMVKSAVKAMDAMQAWSGEGEGSRKIEKFVVSGASKRGWTTWLTSSVDPRVIALAPMVIDTLNFRAQMPRQLEHWGAYSEQIKDYSTRNLTNIFELPEGETLWKLVDPWHYQEKIPQPKLLIHGANDPYWTVDATNVYWNDIRGDKAVVYLPNAGHGLDKNREYALNGVAALYRAAATGRSLAKLGWEHSGDAPELSLRLASDTPMKSARVWYAVSDTRDFRPAEWKPLDMELDADRRGASLTRTLPEELRGKELAILGDAAFEIDGLEYHLSSQIRELSGGSKPKYYPAGLEPKP